MKRKIFGTFAIIAIAVVAGYNVYTSMNKEIQLSNLALSNVEALAQGEWGQGMPKSYFMNKSVWYCIMQRGDTSCYCEM